MMPGKKQDAARGRGKLRGVEEVTAEEIARPTGEVFVCDSDEDMARFLEAVKIRAEAMRRKG